MRRNLTLTAICGAVLAAAAFSSCSGLSSQAKEIVGIYYNPELSQTDPVMELRSDGKCTVRAIKPGVLTYSVDGEWNVENDSIIFDLDPASVKAEGDKAFMGTIPSHYSRRVAGYNEFNLQLEQDGVVYLYQRRAE